MHYERLKQLLWYFLVYLIVSSLKKMKKYRGLNWPTTKNLTFYLHHKVIFLQHTKSFNIIYLTSLRTCLPNNPSLCTCLFCRTPVFQWKYHVFTHLLMRELRFLGGAKLYFRLHRFWGSILLINASFKILSNEKVMKQSCLYHCRAPVSPPHPFHPSETYVRVLSENLWSH